MAVLLARVLAKVADPQDRALREQVTAQDLRNLEALLHEFEADLASLSVRVEVAQETLGRLAQEAGRVRIFGDARFRYEIGRTAVNNPGIGPVLAASTQPLIPMTSTRWRLTVDGGMTDTLRLRLRISSFEYVGTTAGLWGGVPPLGHLNSTFFPWSSGLTPKNLSSFSFNWTHALDLPVEIHLGVLGGDSWTPHEGDPLIPYSLAPRSGAPASPEVIQFGPIGLLFTTAQDSAGERTLRSHLMEGFTLTYQMDQTRLQALVADVESLQGSYGSEVLYGARIQSALSPTVDLGLTVIADSCDGAGALDNSKVTAALTSLGVGQGLARCSFVWWGAQNGWTPALNTGSTNPYTNVPGWGYSLDVDARLAPTLRVQAEWGVWSDPAAQTAGTGWQVQAVIGPPPGQGPAVIVGYQSFDSAFYPPFGGAEDPVVGFIYPGGFRNAFVIATAPFFSGWVLSAGYESGISLGVGPQPGAVGFGGPTFSSAVCQICSPAGQSFSGWLGSLARTIGPETTLRLYYYGWQINGASLAEVYRAEVAYRF